MAATPSGFRLRRTVPYRRVVDGTRYTVGINDMHEEPADVVVGVASSDGFRRERLTLGGVLEIGSERWALVDLRVGDRGSADFEPAKKEQP